jgi:hypothetical protein
MAKIVTAPAAEAPVAAPITALHRISAYARGVSVDAVIAQLRQGLAEAHHALVTLADTTPADDSNLSALRSIHRRLLQFAGEVDLFAPAPTPQHTVFDGRNSRQSLSPVAESRERSALRTAASQRRCHWASRAAHAAARSATWLLGPPHDVGRPGARLPTIGRAFRPSRTQRFMNARQEGASNAEQPMSLLLNSRRCASDS